MLWKDWGPACRGVSRASALSWSAQMTCLPVMACLPAGAPAGEPARWTLQRLAMEADAAIAVR